ncbi:MAG: hypothetical protein QM541_05890 [Flavobacterium sp.]|nr:hypothetical protein [Flavobacterium sp.]
MKSNSIWIKILGSAFITIAGILVAFFLNFSIINSAIIGNEEDYDTTSVKTSKIFDLFYTISSDTGYHPEPSYFNFVFTVLTGVFVGGLISYKLIWRQK